MLTDMTNFNEYFMPAIYESLGQMIDKFNQTSNGAITLQRVGHEGSFLESSFYDALHSSSRRVNRLGANGAVSPTDLTQSKLVAVKLAGGFGPIVWEPSQLTWLRKPTAEGIEIVSRQFAEAMLQDQLNAAISALVGAITGNADAVQDVSGGSVITQAALNLGHARFGDQSQNLVATVMNSQVYHGLIAGNLANTPTLFQASNVRVVDILGKTVVVTDAPALTASVTVGSSPPVTTVKYAALSLASNACVVMDPSDPIVNIETSNGNQRISTTFQADYDFSVQLKGYSWNDVASPSDAELFDSTHWTKVVDSIKNTAGVLIVGDDA